MPLPYVFLLLALLTAGCTRVTPETPTAEPPRVATQPATPRPATTPPTPTTRQPAPAGAPAQGARTPAPQAAGRTTSPVARTPAAAPALDLDALIARLRETKAIGIFTKITLRNQVNDLLDQFRAYYQGVAKRSMTDLRRSYDLLMMKVLSLLQDEDQMLATAIVSSRESIWGLLADPQKFATLQG